MRIEAKSIEEYLEKVPDERKPYLHKLRNVVKSNLPEGFSEELNYGMIGYVVPHSKYPDGYHADPKMPLPFANIANQKGFIALYHMGIYSNPELNKWFTEEYAKRCKYKLDMGKSCIRFKKLDDIPYDLIAELMQKVTMEEWIEVYERAWKK